MRIITLIATAGLSLAGCGGPETSQANNAQANISNDSRTSTNAVGSNVTPANGTAVNSQ